MELVVDRCLSRFSLIINELTKDPIDCAQNM